MAAPVLASQPAVSGSGLTVPLVFDQPIFAGAGSPAITVNGAVAALSFTGIGGSTYTPILATPIHIGDAVLVDIPAGLVVNGAAQPNAAVVGQEVVNGSSVGVYASRADVEQEGGTVNVTAYADVDDDGNAAKITANVNDAIGFADALVSGRLAEAGYTIPLAASPASSTGLTLWVLPVLTRVARKLALWDLYRKRGARDDDRVGDHLQEAYDWAVAELDRLVAQGIPATRTDDDGDPNWFPTGVATIETPPLYPWQPDYTR